MSFLDPYNLETFDAGTSNWHQIINSNSGKINNNMIRLLSIPGAVSQYEAAYLGGGGSTAQAKADSLSTLPAIGIILDTSGSTQRVVTAGVIENGSWLWTAGDPVYVSGLTAGQLTQIRPQSGFVQQIGWAAASNQIFVFPQEIESHLYVHFYHYDLVAPLAGKGGTSFIFGTTTAGKALSLPRTLFRAYVDVLTPCIGGTTTFFVHNLTAGTTVAVDLPEGQYISSANVSLPFVLNDQLAVEVVVAGATPATNLNMELEFM